MLEAIASRFRKITGTENVLKTGAGAMSWLCKLLDFGRAVLVGCWCWCLPGHVYADLILKKHVHFLFVWQFGGGGDNVG